MMHAYPETYLNDAMNNLCLLYTSPAREYATLPSMTMWTPSTEKASLHRS